MANGQPKSVLRYIRSIVGASSTRELTDQQLLARFAADREDAAFEALVQRHGPLVRGVCRRLLPNDHDADDVFQSTFLVLARKAGSVRWRKSVGPWLYEVASRIAAKTKASAARRRLHETGAASQRQVVTADNLTWRELQQVLDEEIQRLPEKYRSPLIHCYLEGKTRDEAADLLGWSIGAVKGRLERGRELLRNRLARRGMTLSAALLAVMLAQNTGSAAVPTALAITTSQAAVQFVSGTLAAGVISVQAIEMAQGTLRAMFLAKLKVIVAALFMVGLVGIGSGTLTHQALSGGKPSPTLQETVREPATEPEIAQADPPPIALENLPAPQSAPDPRREKPQEREREQRGDEERREGVPARGVVRKVSADDRTITLAAPEGEDRRDRVYRVAANAPIIVDNREGQFADLVSGVTVFLMLEQDRTTAVQVRAEGPRQQATIRSIDAGRNTITLQEEKRDRAVELAPDVRIVIDGETGRLEQLAEGMRVVLKFSAVDRRRVVAILAGRIRDQQERETEKDAP